MKVHYAVYRRTPRPGNKRAMAHKHGTIDVPDGAWDNRVTHGTIRQWIHTCCSGWSILGYCRARGTNPWAKDTVPVPGIVRNSMAHDSSRPLDPDNLKP